LKQLKKKILTTPKEMYMYMSEKVENEKIAKKDETINDTA